MVKNWKTKDGKLIPINKLKTPHLDNILKFIKRKATEGVIVYNGHNGIYNDPWCDVETKYGADVYRMYCYEEILAERAKRGNYRKQ